MSEPLHVLVSTAGLTINNLNFRVDRHAHDIAVRIMSELGYDWNEVKEIRLTEGVVEVDIRGWADDGFYWRTVRHDLMVRR
jgi:hypothetical protein